jgi:hypothetical protein
MIFRAPTEKANRQSAEEGRPEKLLHFVLQTSQFKTAESECFVS